MPGDARRVYTAAPRPGSDEPDTQLVHADIVPVEAWRRSRRTAPDVALHMAYGPKVSTEDVTADTPAAPVAPRPAATVLLLRDHPNPPAGRSPLQVFLQRRVPQMAFAAGMTVFPGGSVDPSDVPDADGWAGPSPEDWAETIGVPADLAGGTVSAAVRETFEECGVLLAGPAGAPPLAPQPQAAQWREDLAAHRRPLADVLSEAGFVLRSDLLRVWSRWITPPGPSRRYDTVFFVTLVPEGQEADALTTEAVEAGWWHPAEAFERRDAGEIELMIPTTRTLEDMATFKRAADVVAAAEQRTIVAIRPEVRRRNGRIVIAVEGQADFTGPIPEAELR
jgi:8-oxo-dGTP pyrophosphatase MutT (NUDIX family)